MRQGRARAAEQANARVRARARALWSAAARAWPAAAWARASPAAAWAQVWPAAAWAQASPTASAWAARSARAPAPARCCCCWERRPRHQTKKARTEEGRTGAGTSRLCSGRRLLQQPRQRPRPRPHPQPQQSRHGRRQSGRPGWRGVPAGRRRRPTARRRWPRPLRCWTASAAGRLHGRGSVHQGRASCASRDTGGWLLWSSSPARRLWAYRQAVAGSQRGAGPRPRPGHFVPSKVHRPWCAARCWPACLLSLASARLSVKAPAHNNHRKCEGAPDRRGPSGPPWPCPGCAAASTSSAQPSASASHTRVLPPARPIAPAPRCSRCRLGRALLQGVVPAPAALCQPAHQARPRSPAAQHRESPVDAAGGASPTADLCPVCCSLTQPSVRHFCLPQTRLAAGAPAAAGSLTISKTGRPCSSAVLRCCRHLLHTTAPTLAASNTLRPACSACARREVHHQLDCL